MNRTTLLVLALIVVGVGGYFLIGQGEETPEPVAETIGSPDETADATAGAEADDAGEVTEAAGDTPASADAAEETADIADPVTDVAEDASEPATDTAEDAADAGTDAREGAADAETEAAEETAGTALATPEETTENVPEAGDETAGTTPEVAFPDYLTLEGFDAERARDALDASEIGTVEKASLQAAISAAEDDPALRGEILERLRNVLGF